MSEQRAYDVSLRAVGAGENRTIIGHAAVFDSLSVPLWGFTERIAPGAFRDAIVSSDVRALWNHDPNHVLGRSTAGTLRLAEDERGLAVEIDLPATQMGRDLSVSIGRGDVSQMSFGFNVADDGDEWTTDANGEPVRTIRKVESLFDVSPVTFPAYQETSASVRSRVEQMRAKHYPRLSERFREQQLLEMTL